MSAISEILVVQRELQAYQCDRYGNLRSLILMNELQGLGDKHAEILGVGRTFLTANKIAWVVTHYLVDIIETPREHEVLSFITWPSVSDNLRATRDFEIRGSDNRLLIRATSQWVLLDMETRRLVRLEDRVPFLPKNPQRAWGRTFDKFSDFEPQKTHIFKCRFDDIDVNQHINNSVYAVWATESVGYQYRNTHKLRGIELNYKKEIIPDTPSVEIDVTIDGDISRHRIRVGDTVHAYVNCIWAVR